MASPTVTMSVESVASLLAENERLREELARLRMDRYWEAQDDYEPDYDPTVEREDE